jgi:hypothetical protein
LIIPQPDAAAADIGHRLGYVEEVLEEFGRDVFVNVILLTIDTQLSVEVLSSWNHEEFQDQIDASQPRAAPEGPLG